MLKFSAETADGKILIGLGLSDANLAQLKLGRPIAVDLGAEMVPGSNIIVSIVWGHTEADIRGELTQAFQNPGKIVLRGRGDPNPSNPLQP